MGDEADEDREIAEMQAKLLAMEEEAAKLVAYDGEDGNNGVNDRGDNGDGGEDDNGGDNADGSGQHGAHNRGADGNGENDTTVREIFVGNLHDDVTPDDLNNFFKDCGTVNRITILCDKHTGQSKGFAYMEFEEPEAIDLALELNETELMGKAIKVSRKRQNVPRHMLSRGRGRGRGGFRGRGRGGYRGGFQPRGRGRGRYQPY